MTPPITPVSVTITEEPIRLGQFLKLANLVQDGLEAKMVIQQGDVAVNGVMESRRGRKLIHGDHVFFHGVLYVVQRMSGSQPVGTI
jgi:ribosome-associated protein